MKGFITKLIVIKINMHPGAYHRRGADFLNICMLTACLALTALSRADAHHT